MRLFKDTMVEPFKASVEHRPWGHYGLYSDNEKCTSKILYVKKGEKLSMQYHFKRDQFYLLLDDDFIIDYSDKPVPEKILNEPDEPKRFAALEKFLKDNLITVRASDGDMFGFHRNVVHRTTYLGDRKFGRVLDMAFGENDELDIVRIEDNYGRETKNT